MYKKIFTSLLAFTLMAAAVSGCGSKSNTTTVNNEQQIVMVTGRASSEESYEKPDKGNGHINESLALDTIVKNTAIAMMSKGYDLESVSVEAPDRLNDFFNIIIVANEPQADENNYIKWCTEALELLNAEAIKQDPEYTPSSENYYGGLFDQYRAVLTATSKEEALEKWAVYQTIEPGEHTPVIISDTKFDIGMLN